MLRTFRNIFAIPDLRKRIFFTLCIIALYRLGAAIPTPGVNIDSLKEIIQQEGSIFQFLNIFSGGALQNLAIFGLGIMPYITASIIMEMLKAVIPKLRALQEEGESGRKKITQITRYLTLVLAMIQSSGIVYSLYESTKNDPNPIFTTMSLGKGALIVITLTAGMALLMWMGELITERGIGNGMSLIIFTAIVARSPYEWWNLGRVVVLNYGWHMVALIVAIALFVIVGVVMLTQAERRIPVQYARQVRGRKMTMGGSTYIPLKVNTSGVIPIIFASSVIYFPTILAGFFEPLRGFSEAISMGTFWHYVVYSGMIVFFAYFYTYIAFDPYMQADNLRKYGAFIPGVRPGNPTAVYFSKVLNRINLPGSISLAAIALLPSVVFSVFGTTQVPFGGASIIIIVGVALETMKQIESQLQMRHYEGFLG